MLIQAKKLLKRSSHLTDAVRFVRGTVNGIRFAFQPGAKYTCPICSYNGPFASYSMGPGLERYEIKYTQCPRCELYERHRLQHLVMQDLMAHADFSDSSVLHFAPESRLGRLLKRHFRVYHTADIYEPNVDFKIDITAMPFTDKSYDMIYASHVLEHVQDDDSALREIKRVLKPNGIAVLPVPVVSPRTIEYGSANPFEFGHVRAIGLDYFDRYRKYFADVTVFDSTRYPEKYQLYTFERRDFYPTDKCPFRVPMDGERHSDYVPICRSTLRT